MVVESDDGGGGHGGHGGHSDVGVAVVFVHTQHRKRQATYV